MVVVAVAAVWPKVVTVAVALYCPLGKTREDEKLVYHVSFQAKRA